ncbi:MAG: hypothetical protein QOD80_66 [Verrucomicrobiota bacterium]|jgi:hypothetical protein
MPYRRERCKPFLQALRFHWPSARHLNEHTGTKMNIHRDDDTNKNPLTLLALICLLVIGKCLWHIGSARTLAPINITDFLLWSVFLVLYVKRHRLAWYASFVLFAIIAPLDLFVFQPRRSGESTRIEVRIITAAIWMGFLAYVLYVRPKYWRYLAQKAAPQAERAKGKRGQS